MGKEEKEEWRSKKRGMKEWRRGEERGIKERRSGIKERSGVREEE